MSWGTPVGAPADTHATSPVLSVNKLGSLSLTTLPSLTGLIGIPLLVQPIITALNNAGGLDVTFTGLVTATATGPGVMSGTTATLAVLGVAAYLSLAFSQAGSYTITFTAQGRAPVTTATITIS